MSTYEFQISITPDNYQTQSPLIAHHILHQGGHNVVAGPAPIETPIPEPTIIHYNANQQKPALYGSGEDGFNLSFSNWEAFSDWKIAEEAKNCVDYYKVDSHTSKAVPPRFKEHTKLACSRHTRAGQKKYIRKHPERQRKTPSKKIEIGCPSIICYKTYVESPIVKVNYVSQHSHEIGEANLPFTKKYRKAMTRKGAGNGDAKQSSHTPRDTAHEDDFMDDHQDGDSTTSPEQSQFSHYQHSAEPSLPPSPPASAMEDSMEIHHMERQQHAAYGANIARVPAPPYEPYDPHNLSSQNTSPSISQAPQQQPQQPQQHHIHQTRQHPQQIQQMPLTRHEQPPPAPSQPFNRSREASTVSAHSMNRELHATGHHVSQYHPYHRPVEQHQPPQHQNPQHQPPQPQPQPQTYPHPHQQSQPYRQSVSSIHHSLTGATSSIQTHPPSAVPSPLPDRRTLLQERWTRLETMFVHVRRQANEFEFSDVSLSALEMLLLRLYLESPNNTQPAPMHGNINQHPPRPGRDQNHGMLPQ